MSVRKLTGTKVATNVGDGTLVMSKVMRVRPLNATHHLGLCKSGVRDAILQVLENTYKEEAFTAQFVEHLRKIGENKLDPYSEIEFQLPAFSTRLVFQTHRSEPDEMTYTLPDCSLEPDPRLAAASSKKWFGGIFG